MDVQSLSAIKKAKAALEDKLDSVNTSLEAKMDTISDSVAVELDKGNDRLDNSLAKFDETVDSMPSGVPAPSLESITAVSDKDGITVTVTANTHTQINNSGEDSRILAVTKGVMVRYSDESYPKNKEDGVLGFMDEDLFDVNADGTRVAKAKTHKVTGLTMDKSYYFSAFPYSTGMAYNEQLGTSNVDSCVWMGTKGNLMVNVTTNDSTIHLEEYTISLKPANGNAITKQQTGTGSVVFGDVDSGVYTLSFTYSGVFNKPADQQVIVVSGKSKIVTAQFEIGSNFGSASWKEINRISTLGMAEMVYSVGDTKDITVNGETVTLQIYGFNHDPLADGSGNANITIGTKTLLKTPDVMDINSSFSGGFADSLLCARLNNYWYNGLPDDLKVFVKTVNKKSGAGGSNSGITTNAMKMFLFSLTEVSESGKTEGAKYPIFTNDASRVKKVFSNEGDEGFAVVWWLRTPLGHSNFRCVSSLGKTDDSYHCNSSNYVCFGFCI